MRERFSSASTSTFRSMFYSVVQSLITLILRARVDKSVSYAIVERNLRTKHRETKWWKLFALRSLLCAISLVEQWKVFVRERFFCYIFCFSRILLSFSSSGLRRNKTIRSISGLRWILWQVLVTNFVPLIFSRTKLPRRRKQNSFGYFDSFFSEAIFPGPVVS